MSVRLQVHINQIKAEPFARYKIDGGYRLFHSGPLQETLRLLILMQLHMSWMFASIFDMYWEMNVKKQFTMVTETLRIIIKQ